MGHQRRLLGARVVVRRRRESRTVPVRSLEGCSQRTTGRTDKSPEQIPPKKVRGAGRGRGGTPPEKDGLSVQGGSEVAPQGVEREEGRAPTQRRRYGPTPKRSSESPGRNWVVATDPLKARVKGKCRRGLVTKEGRGFQRK